MGICGAGVPIAFLIAAIRFPKKMPALYARAPFKLGGFWLKFVSILALVLGGFFIITLIMESLAGALILDGWFVAGVMYCIVSYRIVSYRLVASPPEKTG